MKTKNIYYIVLRRKGRLVRALLMLFLLAGSNMVFAQDLHFSQWFNAPLMVNPANAGFIPDADYKLGANYRNQWSSIMTVPFKTMGVWGDVQVFRNKIESGWVGLGGSIMQDVAGSGLLRSTKIRASVAYHQMLGTAHLLSAGFNAGWANKRINTHDLKFPDQFDGRFFDKDLPTSVYLDHNSVGYLDMQVGINYAYFPTSDLYINGGVSVMHFNRPRESFFTADDPGFDNRISPRYNVFANMSYKLNEWIILNPMAYYSRQSTASEIVGGGTLQYNLSGDGESQLLGGLFYRHNEAVIPMVGFAWKNIRLMFSYDATVSTLNNFNSGRGAFEFSLVSHSLFNNYNGVKRQSLCPTF